MLYYLIFFTEDDTDFEEPEYLKNIDKLFTSNFAHQAAAKPAEKLTFEKSRRSKQTAGKDTDYLFVIAISFFIRLVLFA